jgi:hypothetical protein
MLNCKRHIYMSLDFLGDIYEVVLHEGQVPNLGFAGY